MTNCAIGTKRTATKATSMQDALSALPSRTLRVLAADAMVAHNTIVRLVAGQPVRGATIQRLYDAAVRLGVTIGGTS